MSTKTRLVSPNRIILNHNKRSTVMNIHSYRLIDEYLTVSTSLSFHYLRLQKGKSPPTSGRMDYAKTNYVIFDSNWKRRMIL